jgi:hypothetical protein
MEKIIDRVEVEGYSYAVGCDNITEIKARQEDSGRWFEMWRGNHHSTDVNGRYVISISYKNPEDKF